MLFMNLVLFSIRNLRFIILGLFLILPGAKNCLFVKFLLVQTSWPLDLGTQLKMSQIHANNALRILHEGLSRKWLPLASRAPIFLNLFNMVFNFLIFSPFFEHVQRSGGGWWNSDVWVQIEGKLVRKIWNVQWGNCNYVFVSLKMF